MHEEGDDSENEVWTGIWRKAQKNQVRIVPRSADIRHALVTTPSV